MRRTATSLAVVLTALVTCAGSAAAAAQKGAAPAGSAQKGTARKGAAQKGTAQKGAAPAPPKLPVTGASLMVAGSNTPLWSFRGNAKLPIASTTKMMTALVVLQHVGNLKTVFTQNDWDAAAADSQIGLIPGERMTVHDLLVALLLPSADDAAEDLAYNVGGGSVGRFVSMMNADARTLGLRRTHYSTPIGLDTPSNYSSPDDLVRLGDYMMRKWPFFRRTVGLASATLASGRYVRHVVNTDDLVGRYWWIRGIKTGHTQDAGYVLVSEGRRDGFTLVASVLGTTSEGERDSSALALLNWGFSALHVITPVYAGEAFARRSVPYETAPALVVAQHGYRAVVARSERVRVVVGRLRKLAGPMAKGTVVGHVTVLIHGRRAVRIPLVLSRRLPAVSLLTKAEHLIKRPFTLLVLALLLGGVAVAVVGRRRRPRVLATGRLEER